MINSENIEKIEYQAINDYLDDIVAKRKYPSETLHGDVQRWNDVDDYFTVTGTCRISGDTIKDWITDRFDSILAEFLKMSDDAQSLEELASDDDLYDEQSYYDFVYDICDSVEDYFWESDIYQELCNQYFEDHADEDYD